MMARSSNVMRSFRTARMRGIRCWAPSFLGKAYDYVDPAISATAANVKQCKAKIERSRLNENEKIIVLSRQNMRCNMCTCKLVIHPYTNRKLFEFDHVIPRHKRGPTTLNNMQALCRNCHGVKTGWDLM
jgi:5-methylcytosine-specific restriction endonuclease McrA